MKSPLWNVLLFIILFLFVFENLRQGGRGSYIYEHFKLIVDDFNWGEKSLRFLEVWQIHRCWDNRRKSTISNIKSFTAPVTMLGKRKVYNFKPFTAIDVGWVRDKQYEVVSQSLLMTRMTWESFILWKFRSEPSDSTTHRKITGLFRNFPQQMANGKWQIHRLAGLSYYH